ncbi:MAG: DUF2750 domain-containing protein [Gaiellaceae bacterium]
MTPGERYDYLVRHVAETGRIWLLEDDAGLVGQADDEGRRYLAVWPDSASAEACAVDEWADAKANAMELNAWIEEALPAIAETGGMLSAFPTPDHQGFIVPPLGMKADLEEELGS